MLSRISFIALMTLLAACAQTLPVTTEPPANDAPAPSARLHDLEAAAAQLRQQQLAMGESLTWLEGEIKALHQRDSAPHSAPTAPTAQAMPQTIEAEPIQSDVKNHHAGPTTLVPESTPPSVDDLNTADLQAEPTAAALTATPAQSPTLTTGYAVHVASFSRTEQLHKGWREIKQRYSAEIGTLRPFGTRFTDNQGRVWARLNIGPFTSRQDADTTCTRLKTAGAFCDVQPVTAGSASEVR